MKSFVKYFFYHFKDSLLRLAVLAVAFSVLIMNTVRIRNGYYYAEPVIRYCVAQTDGLFGYLVLLAILIAALEFYIFKNRRNLDTYYAFPISREKMALSHWLCGVIHLAIISVVGFTISYFILLPLNNARLIYLLPYWALTFLAMTTAYSIASYFIVKMNTVFDAAMVMGGVIMFFVFLVDFLGSVFSVDSFVKSKLAIKMYSFVYKIIDYIFNSLDISGVFDTLITNVREIELRYNYWIVALGWFIIGVIAFFLMLYEARRSRANKAGGVSDSFVGYKSLIPLVSIAYLFNNEFYLWEYGHTVLFMSKWNELDFSYLFIPVAVFIAYVIYRRSLKLKRSDIIWTCVVGVLVITVMILPNFINRVVMLLVNPSYEPPIIFWGYVE